MAEGEDANSFVDEVVNRFGTTGEIGSEALETHSGDALENELAVLVLYLQNVARYLSTELLTKRLQRFCILLRAVDVLSERREFLLNGVVDLRLGGKTLVVEGRFLPRRRTRDGSLRWRLEHDANVKLKPRLGFIRTHKLQVF